jgi:hypothetical protein
MHLDLWTAYIFLYIKRRTVGFKTHTEMDGYRPISPIMYLSLHLLEISSANLTRVLGSLDSQPGNFESRTSSRLSWMSWDILGQSATPCAPMDSQLTINAWAPKAGHPADCQPSG